MFSAWSLFLLALTCLGLLFLVAWAGERRPLQRDHPKVRGVLYALSLGVYCTSWTFYGAVGNAATTGWGFLPIYLGPILLMVFGFGVLRRIAEGSREHRITSIADYIAHRYGRSHAIAVLVTVAAVVGAVPYIALQLKGIVTSMEVLTGVAEAGTVGGPAGGLPGGPPGGMALWLAVLLAIFAMAFGTRRLDAAEHQRGLIWAIAFESVIKLVAFVAVGCFALFGLLGGGAGFTELIEQTPAYRDRFSPWHLPEGFVTQLVLAMTAVLCLPRQFHVAIVEYRGVGELKVARWLFPAYLLLFTLFVVPIAIAGLERFGAETVNPDAFVLALPLAEGHGVLALLAFVGGFSAATGMVIVSTVALAIMVSNHLVMPLLIRRGPEQRLAEDLPRTLVWVRRGSILAITLAAYVYFRGLEGGMPLASIGLLAFSAAAQFAPAMLLGLYWRGASQAGAVTGLAVGTIAWFLLLLLPSFTGYAPLGDELGFNEAAGIALGLNALALVIVSLLVPDLETQRRQESSSGRLITMGELQATLGRFLGLEPTRAALATELGASALEPRALASPATLQFGERLLAGAIGSASARSVLRSALRHRGLDADEVLDLLDQTSQAVQFNRELLEATLDNLTQGVSVVDEELRLVGWNRRYIELMAYPEGTVYLGQPVAELIARNADRGLLGEGRNDEAGVEQRLDRLRVGKPYRTERPWLDGKVIEIRGRPMPGGGYVTTFTDITHYKDIERELQEVNESLEQRVTDRTQALQAAVGELDAAREMAEAANRSKTDFLAAASHDLLQPMNAARLFLSVLRQRPDDDEERSRLVMRADRSLTAAEELLSALLDISKLDTGAMEPELEIISVEELFEQLRRRFKALAANRGLRLRVRARPERVVSDRNLLYRVLQNLLSNALRYTESGGVLLACRRRGDALQLSVWDTGIGIAEEDQARIFEEFQRLEAADQYAERGLGLGLAITDRMARVLEHPLTLRSTPGRGSAFLIEVPLAPAGVPTVRAGQPEGETRTTPLEGAVVLCVDNEPEILEGMTALLERWGIVVQTAVGGDSAVVEAGIQAPDLVLMDYHLDADATGLDVLKRLREEAAYEGPAVVITADRSPELEEELREAGLPVLRKPLRPAALRALASNLLR
ncbi:MAG: PAS domain-containing hybrid sensor histidine kinase/response regulator [Pseudomonadota bacterium]